MPRPKKQQPKKHGAPYGNKNAEKFVDWNKVDELLKIGCNQEEIAAVLGVSIDALCDHAKREKGCLFADYIKRGSTDFKVGIRRSQMRSAIGVPRYDPDGKVVGWITPPSVVMQIWLGKQYLEQRDKIETDATVHQDVIKGFNLIVNNGE